MVPSGQFTEGLATKVLLPLISLYLPVPPVHSNVPGLRTVSPVYCLPNRLGCPQDRSWHNNQPPLLFLLLRSLSFHAGHFKPAWSSRLFSPLSLKKVPENSPTQKRCPFSISMLSRRQSSQPGRQASNPQPEFLLRRSVPPKGQPPTAAALCLS